MSKLPDGVKIIRKEQLNERIKVFVKIDGLRPAFNGVGFNELEACEDAVRKAKALVDSL